MSQRKNHRVLFVGDIVIGAQCGAAADVKALIDGLDVDWVVGNAEIPFTSRGSAADKFVAWRTEPAAALWLQAAGFNAVSLRRKFCRLSKRALPAARIGP